MATWYDVPNLCSLADKSSHSSARSGWHHTWPGTGGPSSQTYIHGYRSGRCCTGLAHSSRGTSASTWLSKQNCSCIWCNVCHLDRKHLFLHDVPAASYLGQQNQPRKYVRLGCQKVIFYGKGIMVLLKQRYPDICSHKPTTPGVPEYPECELLVPQTARAGYACSNQTFHTSYM